MHAAQVVSRLSTQRLSLRIAIACAILAGANAQAEQDQPVPPASEIVAIEPTIDSGPVRNEGEAPQVVFSTTIRVPGALWLRLEFDEVLLAGTPFTPRESRLHVTSTLDGAQQRLNAVHVEQWRHTSAYFNGDEVTIEIIAQPGTGENRVALSRVVAGRPDLDPASICGPTDDRLPSEDPRVARILPSGCTSWLIDDCSGCLLTAGHCGYDTVQFNVPLSDANGNMQHPPPEDQYAADLSSRQTANNGIGDDYSYYGAFPNANTGLTPREAQGDQFTLSLPPPVQGQEIRITGHGTTGPDVPPQWNRAQKTHAGPYFSFTGTRLQYQTDTTGGNSGSPVIDDSTGYAIGVHTHGGCSANQGNSGTGLNNNGLQSALGAPRGVCECDALFFHYPNGLPELLDPRGGTTFQVHVSALDAEPQPETGVLHFDDGSGPASTPMAMIDDHLYLAEFPAFDCGALVSFYVSVETTAGVVVTDPPNAPARTFLATAARDVRELVHDDMETDPGWTVENVNLADGAWERGVPVGGGGRGDPPTDFDGSGQCWLTGNRAGDSDVDGGPTILTSPSYDLSGVSDAILSYARWFTCDDAGTGDEDFMHVEISADGQNWTTLETVASVAGWRLIEHRIADFIAPGPDVRVRFSVQDQPNNSVTEAAIDALRIVEVFCDDCPADLNGDGVLDVDDFFTFLDLFAAGDDRADFNSDGTIDVDDFFAFLDAFAAGCG